MHKLNKIIKLKSIVNHARLVRDFVFDLIFPIACVNCGQEGFWLCSDCAKMLKFSRGQYCLGCKTENKNGEFCAACRKNFSFDGILIAGDYENKIIAQLIKELKYHFAEDISLILGKYLANFLQLYAGNSMDHKSKIINPQSLLIPVPLHPRRRRWRGFNQAEKLALALTDNFKLDIDSHNLIRSKYTRPQVKLSAVQRQNNVKDCFAWIGPDLCKKNIILLDDVATTGATLNECARVLKQNNAGEVWGLVAANG